MNKPAGWIEHLNAAEQQRIVSIHNIKNKKPQEMHHDVDIMDKTIL